MLSNLKNPLSRLIELTQFTIAHDLSVLRTIYTELHTIKSQTGLVLVGDQIRLSPLKMAERDYRVTYKTREVDDDRPRRRIPTALDPYLYPEDRDELKRNVALARVGASRYANEGREPQDFETSVRRETIRDDVSRTTARGPAQPGATKTTYSVTSAGLEKESEVTLRGATKTREPTVAAGPSPSVSRRSEYREVDDIEIDRERTTTMPIRTVRASTKPYDDQDYSRYDRVYEVERPRKENGVYVIDASTLR